MRETRFIKKEEKWCKACSQFKKFTEFTINRNRYHGLNNYCKECQRIKNRAIYRKYRERNIERTSKYSKSHPENTLRYVQNWIKNNQEKYRAHVKVRALIRTGTLLKGVCEICGLKKVHAHHDDYSKPLEIRWLCPTHHKELHTKEALEAKEKIIKAVKGI